MANEDRVMKRGLPWRAVAALLTLTSACGTVPVGHAWASTTERTQPTWTTAPRAPISGRTLAAAVGLSEVTTLIFGGEAGAGGMVAMVPVGGGTVPTRDTAIFNLDTGTWTPVAPVPDGVTVTETSEGSPSRRDPVGSNGFAYALARHPGGGQPQPPAPNAILRFDAAANRWHTVPLPAVEIWQMVAAAGRLVVLDLGPDRVRQDPGGALLDTDGSWHMLPPLPSDKHGNKHIPWHAGTWVDNHLLLTSKTSNPLDGRIHVAALNLDNMDEGWVTRPAVNSPHRRPNNLPPVAVAGRIVWPMVVYNPATGRSTATPAAIRDKLQRHDGLDPSDAVPSMLTLSDHQVTLAGFAFDPVTGKTTAIPQIPPSSVGGGAAWTGGPRGILGFGGVVQSGPVNTTTDAAVRLLPAK